MSYRITTRQDWFFGISSTNGFPDVDESARSQHWEPPVAANRVIHSRKRADETIEWLMQVGSGDRPSGVWYAWVPMADVKNLSGGET